MLILGGAIQESLCTFDGPVVGVEEEGGEGAGLRSSIPAVAAVDEAGDPAPHRVRNEDTRVQDRLDVLQPAAPLHSLPEPHHPRPPPAAHWNPDTDWRERRREDSWLSKLGDGGAGSRGGGGGRRLSISRKRSRQTL